MMLFMNHEIKHFEIQGHRGCRGLMPENTIPAFIKAIDLGVETLEMDVVISKDKKVVVSHEPQFNPVFTTKKDGTHYQKFEDSNLYQLTYNEIKSHDVGLRGNPLFPEQEKINVFKPLLSDVIKEVKAHLKTKGKSRIAYNIEIKSLPEEYNKTQPEVKEFVDLVLKVIGKNISPADLTLQSFDFNVLQHLNSLNKEKHRFKISALIEPEDNNEIDFNIEKLKFKPDIWSPYFKVLDEVKVKYLHSLGIQVIPWTVNSESEMEQVFDLQCDGLITDYPNRAVKYIKK
ncbi:glycerophosphodiester phosphodiesterase [Lacihabitans sp. LS3-19]|nr:glycerophosphodiester phosphodiesterase [Lacihabitans sp. LS3-19]